jgi:hypothetical protein
MPHDPDDMFLRISVSRNLYAPDALHYRMSDQDKKNIEISKTFLNVMGISTKINFRATGICTFMRSDSAHLLDRNDLDDWRVYDGETKLELDFRVEPGKVFLVGRCSYVHDDEFEELLDLPAVLTGCSWPSQDEYSNLPDLLKNIMCETNVVMN